MSKKYEIPLCNFEMAIELTKNSIHGSIESIVEEIQKDIPSGMYLQERRESINRMLSRLSDLQKYKVINI